MSVNLLDQWRLAQAIISDPSIGSPAARVAVALLGFQNRRTDRCNPSIETLGNAAGLKQSATREAVAALEKAGWITSEGKGGRAKSNAYTFAWERLKPAGNPDGLDEETHREAGTYERVNVPDIRAKRAGYPARNPKEEPSLAIARERGGAIAPRTPGGGAVAPRRRSRKPEQNLTELMLMHGRNWEVGR